MEKKLKCIDLSGFSGDKKIGMGWTQCVMYVAKTVGN